MKRYSKLNAKKRAEFLACLAECGIVTQALAESHLYGQAVYELRKKDEGFRAAWEEAIEQAVGALELEARRRAKDGYEEPVFYQGEQVGRMTRYSDNLLMFLLKAARPDKYRDRLTAELTGPDGEPLGPAMVHVYLPDNGRGDRTGSPRGSSDAED